MSAARRSAAAAFVRSVEALLDSLPTSQERLELVRGIDALTEFLLQIKTSLGSLPDTDAQLRTTLDAVEDSLKRIESNEVTSGILGLRRPPQRKSVPTLDLRGSDELLGELRQLNEEQLRGRLNSMSPALIRGVARVLGLATTRVSREALASQVAAKIINSQGYEILRRDGRSGADNHA